jgi:hypothetical protein
MEKCFLSTYLPSISSQSLVAIGSLRAYFVYLSVALFLGPFVPFPPLYDYKGFWRNIRPFM